jgi:hypothetical protein
LSTTSGIDFGAGAESGELAGGDVEGLRDGDEALGLDGVGEGE